jgi:hypothetical protein
MKKFIVIFLLKISIVFGSENILESDVFRDTKKTHSYVHVCSQDKDTYWVAESCGKHWEKTPRKREEIIKEVATFQELKKGSKVMVKVKKGQSTEWIIGTVSFLYENGEISVMEYYSNWGYNPGTKSRIYKYSEISKAIDLSDYKSNEEMCVVEKIELNYSYDNDKKFIFEIGDKLILKSVMSNQQAIVSLKDEWFLSRYGTDNTIPVPLNKIQPCSLINPERGLQVNNVKRNSKESSDSSEEKESNNTDKLQLAR